MQVVSDDKVIHDACVVQYIVLMTPGRPLGRPPTPGGTAL